MLDRLYCLRHHTVIRGDYENDNVGRLGAAGTHHRESFVTRRVEENNASLLARVVRVWHLHAVCADVLRDSTGFALGYIVGTDGVEERGFPVIDMTHNGHYRCSRQFDIVGI